MEELNYRQTADWLRERNRFLILTHIRPDGDTIGSGAALCSALRKAGKEAFLLYNEGITSTYAPYAAPYWAEKGYCPDFVVAVDLASEGLFPESAGAYKGKVDLCIDHHPSNERYAEKLCLEAQRAACGETMLEICKLLCPLDDEIATLLYVAVSTDTGCFVYSNTTADTHRAAAELLEYSSRYKEVNKRCFRTKSFKRLRLEAMLMEGLELHQNGTVAIAAVSQAMMKQIGATEDDAEDLSAFAGQIEGVRISATLREMEGGKRCKISLRTDASLNATETCALLGGGGHAAASGASVNMDLPHAKEAILKAIETVQERHREN